MKQRLFTLIAWLIPIALLLLAELVLRIVGFGQQVPLFVTAPSHEGMLTPNPNLIQRFFHLDSSTPNVSPDSFYFTLQKPDDSLRIVLMGGSTAAGFPYGRFGSPAGLLTHQLRAVYPNRDIEVIPVAMASINSYALRDIAKETLKIQPDAVLVYAGHNEYLGVMGVGSAYANQGSHITNLLFLTLKDCRLFQLMQWLINSKTDRPADQAGRTNMAAMAKEQKIPFDSKLYHKGIAQYKDNMQALLGLFERAKVPVLLANLVANEKDLKPFSSSDPDDFASYVVAEYRLTHNDKMSQLEQWQTDFPYSANIAFNKGKLLAKSGEYQSSRDAFLKAIDYDELRFRAPSAFNIIASQLADAKENVTLVDLSTHLRRDETDKIIGSKLMLEHLHPTARGYFLMADGFLHALVDAGLLPEPSFPLTRSVQYRWQQLPLNEVDKLVAAHKIKQLTSDYPFTSTPKVVAEPSGTDKLSRLTRERLQNNSWLTQQNELLRFYQLQKQWLKAANVAAQLFEALPTNVQAAEAALNLYLRARQNRLAWYYGRQAAKLNPDSESILLGLAQAQYRSEDEASAMQTLEATLQRFPNNQQAKTYLNNLKANKTP